MGGEVKKRLMRLPGLDLAVIHHAKYLEARSQERILQSFIFLDAWEQAKLDERKKVIFWIKRVKPLKIRDWVRAKIGGELEGLSIINLRKMASHYHIKNYSRKSRLQLVQEIEERKKDAIKRCKNKS